MLSQSELSALYKLISEDNQSFEKISESFQSIFKDENLSKVGTSIIILLKDNLLNITQKIISYYILYEITKRQKMGVNPYIPIILEMLQKSQNKNEQNFLLDFLYNKINYGNITIENYLSDKSREPKINWAQIQMQWGKYYMEVLKKNNINLNINTKQRPIAYDRNQRDLKNMDTHQSFNFSMTDSQGKNIIENELNLNYFLPNYLSYNPINNNFINSEPIWLLPSLKHCFIWEKNNNKEN